MKKALLFICLLVAMAPPVHAANISLYSTGVTSVDASGTPTLTTEGQKDIHYGITSVNNAASFDGYNPPTLAQPPVSGAQDAFVVYSYVYPLGTYWVQNGPNSNWISPSPDTNGVSSIFTYSTTFDLAGLDQASARITGSWSTDDPGWMFLNGQLVSSLPYGWMFLQLYGQQQVGTDAQGNPIYANHDFTLSTGFLPGVNTLEFLVWNSGGGPTGLRVEIASATANPVPEPGTMLLLGSGLAWLVGYGRRRMKKQ